jgi:hypothetical protein
MLRERHLTYDGVGEAGLGGVAGVRLRSRCSTLPYVLSVLCVWIGPALKRVLSTRVGSCTPICETPSLRL